MEPIPEVRAAEAQLAALADDTLDLVDTLRTVAGLAVTLVPSCTGVSITVVVDGEPFTVTATSEQTQLLDAAQYMGGGPCVDTAQGGEGTVVDDVLDEARWQLFAQAAAATGVRASISIPLQRPDGTPFAALNLYASDPAAFAGERARQLASVFGLHVGQVVANADLAFTTRDSARALSQRIEDKARVDEAVGVLMGLHGWSAEHARERLHFAADHAGTSRVDVAQMVMLIGLD